MNNSVYTLDEMKSRAIPVAKRYNLASVSIFGSYARGEADEESDVDILVSGGDIRGLFDLGELYGAFEEALEKPIDLVRTEALKKKTEPDEIEAEMIGNIERDKVLIYEK